MNFETNKKKTTFEVLSLYHNKTRSNYELYKISIDIYKPTCHSPIWNISADWYIVIHLS